MARTLTALRGSAAVRCTVCGKQVKGQYYVSSTGAVWCARHHNLPKCQWCGVPTRRQQYGGPNCDACTRSAIKVTDEAMVSIRRVGAAMARRGFRIGVHVRVVLDGRRDLENEGLFSGSPHQLGVTHYAYTSSNQPKDLTIALLEGMPRVLFEACFAHEYGHALLAGTPASRAADWVGEGFSECLAFAYLVEDERSPSAKERARAIRTNPDQTYGGGFRKVHASVKRHGLTAVAEALVDGRMSSVGL